MSNNTKWIAFIMIVGAHLIITSGACALLGL